jgi:hypothetical protein
MRTGALIVLALSLVACGGSDAAPTTPVVEAPPTTIAPPSAPPTTTVAATVVPDDFAISLGGGAVMRQEPQPGERHLTVRLEPRPGTAGAFDLVERSETSEMTGSPSPPVEIRRAPVPAERVTALWTSITTNRAVLEGPCANMEIMDGATRSIDVHASGADSSFRCTNASTPEFDALSDAFGALRDELLPPPPADS